MSMQPQFIITTPFNVRIEEKGGVQEVHLDGFISTTDQDLVDDIVTKNCLESMKNQIIDRNLKLDIEHEAFRGDTPEEKELNKTKIPAGRMYDAVVETIGAARYGLRVKSMLNNFNKDFKNIKGNVITKMLDAYSIAFIPTKTSEKVIKGKMVRFLEDVILLNVGMTGNPINTNSKNRDIFMKAINSLEDYKKEKKSNPGVGDTLEVKDIESKPGGHGYVTCPKCGKKFKKDIESKPTAPLDDEDDGVEDEEDKKHPKKKKKNYSKKHNHKSDNKLNQGGKIMENSHKDEEANEEASEESNDEEGSKEPESTESESTEAKDEESNDDSDNGKSDDDKDKEEVKSLKKKVNSLEKTVKKMESHMKKPMHKSVSESRPKNLDESSKSIGPLDEFK